MEKLKSYTEMSKLCCINDLIRFMINESEKLMNGLVHKNNFFIFHDALVLITSKETINWMRQNSYLHIWLLPPNVLQDRTPYAVRHVGNSLDFMPLDNSQNCDILHSLRIHRVLSG